MAPTGSAATIMSATVGRIRVNLTQPSADLLTTFGAGALIQLEDSATEDGSYTQVSATAIVSATEQYEITDTTASDATWYKVRVSDSGEATFSGYSDAFRHTSRLAYATLDDLRKSMDLPDTSRDNYLTDHLRVASEQIDSACGRQFYRNPQVSGDGTFYVDVSKSGRDGLIGASGGYTTTGEPLDVISITTLSVRDSESGSYTEVSAGDTGYYLDADHQGFPYRNVSLSPAGTYTVYPTGKRAVKLEGVLGFSSVPQAVRNACLDMAREAYRQGPGGGPSQIGSNQFGAPVYLTGFPQSYRALIAVGSPYLRRTYTYV